MERSERFYRIETLIKARGSVTLLELLAELGVSRATLKRDLEHLRTRLDAPLVYQRSCRGYCFAPAPSRRRTGDAELAPVPQNVPGIWFSEAELHVLLSMRQQLVALGPQATLGRHLLPLLERLQDQLGPTPEASQALLKRLKLELPASPPSGGAAFALCASALLQRQRLQFELAVPASRKPRKGAGKVAAAAVPTRHEVSPQRLVHTPDGWQLDAWCHEAKALQRHALATLQSPQLLAQRAKEVALKQVEACFDAASPATARGGRGKAA